MKKSLKEKQLESKKLLLQVFLEGADTKEEKLKAHLNYQFVLDCLEIRRVSSLMGLGKKRTTGYLETLNIYERLLEQKIRDEYSLGIQKKKLIEKSGIKSVEFTYSIKYRKAKGKDGKKRIHTDTFECDAEDEETALILLRHRLKKIKEELIEVLKIDKTPSYFLMNDGEIHHIESVELK